MPDAHQSAEAKIEYRLPVGTLYPNLTAAEQREAEYFLAQYLEVVRRIYEENENLTSSNLNTRV